MDRKSLEQLIGQGAVKGLVLVNRESLEIRLDKQALKQGGLNESYDSEVIYTLPVKSRKSFDTYYHELQQSLPENKRINYAIEQRVGMSAFIWNWVALLVIFAIIFIIPLFIFLFLIGKLRFNSQGKP